MDDDTNGTQYVCMDEFRQEYQNRHCDSLVTGRGHHVGPVKDADWVPQREAIGVVEAFIIEMEVALDQVWDGVPAPIEIGVEKPCTSLPM